MEYDPIPFDHTYILYDPKDVVSIVCVHFSLLPIYIMVFYTSWFLITREIEPVIVVGGHLIGEVLNKVIKHLLKLPRPDFHKDFGISSGHGLTYGMPSAHSQFMGFFAAYFACILMKVPLKKIQRKLGVVGLLLSSLLVAFSRVYLLYHTPQQTVVGLLVGIVLGLAYFLVTSIARELGFVDWVLGWKIVAFFYIKDSYHHCYHTFRQEYLAVEKEKQQRIGAAAAASAAAGSSTGAVAGFPSVDKHK